MIFPVRCKNPDGRTGWLIGIYEDPTYKPSPYALVVWDDGQIQRETPEWLTIVKKSEG